MTQKEKFSKNAHFNDFPPAAASAIELGSGTATVKQHPKVVVNKKDTQKQNTHGRGLVARFVDLFAKEKARLQSDAESQSQSQWSGLGLHGEKRDAKRAWLFSLMLGLALVLSVLYLVIKVVEDSHTRRQLQKAGVMRVQRASSSS